MAIQISSWLRSVLWALAVGLLVGLWTGYKWGARDARAIKAAEALATQESKATEERLKNIEAQIEAQYKAKSDEIDSNFAAQQAKLQASIDSAQDRLTQARRDESDTSARIESLRQQMSTANGREKDLLMQRINDLSDMRQRLEQTAKGLDCLRTPVPADELGLLRQEKAL